MCHLVFNMKQVSHLPGSFWWVFLEICIDIHRIPTSPQRKRWFCIVESKGWMFSGSDFILSWGCWGYSPRFAWGGRPHRRLFWPTQTYIQKISQKHCLFQCFYNVFRRKHRNLRGFRHKVGPKQWFLQCFQGSGIKKSSMPWSWKHSYLHCFLQFFPVPMPLANSNIYTKNPSKTLFFSVFLHFFRQKRRNLHVFRLKVGPKHWFLQCFQCSGIQKPFKISLFIDSVFSFLSVFPLPEADQNDPKFRFNGLLGRQSGVGGFHGSKSHFCFSWVFWKFTVPFFSGWWLVHKKPPAISSNPQQRKATHHIFQSILV